MSSMFDVLKNSVHRELDIINNAYLMKKLSIEIIRTDIDNDIKKKEVIDNVNCNNIIDNDNEIIHTNFRLPINYLDKSDVFTLSNIVADDLELTKNIKTGVSSKTNNDESLTSSNSMYDYLFCPKNQFAIEMIQKWKNEYTTNVDYLNDTKEILKKMESYESKMESYIVDCSNITTIWKDLKKDELFLDKYGYMDWNILKYLNESSGFLQALSFINITSPLISLIIPIFFLIVPFILLKIQRVPITFDVYYELLLELAKNHFIGKSLSAIKSISWDKVVYLIVTFGLYLLQIYQNINQCKRFYNNIMKINKTLIEMREYVGYSINSMQTFLNIARGHHSYNDFCNDVEKHCSYLNNLYSELSTVKPFNHSITKFGEFGNLLRCYYRLHSVQEYEEGLRYSMGFEGYINNMFGVSNNLKNGIICYGSLTNKPSCHFKSQYYPPIMNENPIKNSCKFDKNMIISAPNKAGKTTILKTTILNIIFTQQIGCGFYESATLMPYTHIHSYLNIPDTSGRDSLFQAESRRCKDILDVITKYSDGRYRHFCTFDELYSGTNPEEASKAGHAFLEYLSKCKNVNFILTTHYLSICKKYKVSNYIQNYKMHVNVLENGHFEYTYKIKKGISSIKGALRVLKDMNYPEEIIRTIEG
jgi:hypothetical protein